MKQNSSSSQRTQIIIVSALLGVGILALCGLLAYAFRGNLLQLAAFSTPTPIAPTPQCIETTLTLGTNTFHVKTVPNTPNAFPVLPQSTADSAYWIEGTTVNYVFGLSPVGNNLTLNTALKAGDPMVIHWGDCSTDAYVVSSIDTGQPNDLKVFDQSQGGITVYVKTGASNIVIHGVHPAIQSNETAQPEPTSQFQIDVVFADQPAPDPQTVKIGLTITNHGAQPLTLNNSDLSLTVENSPSVAPTAVEPALPQQIDPGQSIQVSVTFPKPPAPSAVLRIFDTTVDYYFQ